MNVSIGDVTLTPRVVDGALLSLGDIRVGGTPLRNPALRFLPWFDTFQGDIFRTFRLEDITLRGEQTVFVTRAVSDPDAPMFREMRDTSGDLVLREHSWDAPPLEAHFRIVLTPASAELDGHHFSGFKYWFEYDGEQAPLHRLLDRQTWEVGGNLDDLQVVCRNLFDLPRKRIARETGYSTVGLDHRADLLPGNLWARWSLLPAFDMQYGRAGTLLGWFDRVACIRSVIESHPGEDWLRYVDLHYFEQSTYVATNPKTILYCPDRLDDVDALNLWTRVYDREHEKACRQFGIREEAPPCMTEAINVWRNFHFDTTYEQAVDVAAELGMDYVFIDSIWQNLETYERTLKQLVGEDRIARTVLGKTFIENMCCTLDFEVSSVAGGEERLKALCERAAAKGVKILSWMAAHYTPISRYFGDKTLGHGAGGIFACKESGRHPDTGAPGQCWTANLNAPIFQKLRGQVLGVCARTGLAGYLWDSYSNMGWWQVDYSDGTMRPQFDKMGQLYADLANDGLYVQPEGIVSFSNHSCCGLHGGDIYAGDLLGYSYNTVISLDHPGRDGGPWGGDPTGDVLRGKQPLDRLFQCFAHKRIPTMSLHTIPRDEWDDRGADALKALFRAYKAARGWMQRRTVLKDDRGVLWDGDGRRVLWSFRAQPAPEGDWRDLLADETPARAFVPNRVYVTRPAATPTGNRPIHIMKTFGLALGGGGARGLAHALVLEALDEMGCRPAIIAGTSIGALLGAIYASGVPGKTIRENIQRNLFSPRDSWSDIFKRRTDLLKVIRTVALERGPGGTVKADRFLSFLLTAVHTKTFEELQIPLLVIATDYWNGTEVVLKAGDLLRALKASIAIPGVFAPVRIDDRVLLDGGLVDLVPYEHIVDRCDVSIAVNVAGSRTPGKTRTPRVWEALMGSIQIMQEVNLSERMKRRRPDVCVHPEIVDVSVLAFGKAARVLRQAAPAVQAMKHQLEEILARP